MKLRKKTLRIFKSYKLSLNHFPI